MVVLYARPRAFVKGVRAWGTREYGVVRGISGGSKGGKGSKGVPGAARVCGKRQGCMESGKGVWVDADSSDRFQK